MGSVVPPLISTSLLTEHPASLLHLSLPIFSVSLVGCFASPHLLLLFIVPILPHPLVCSSVGVIK